jgi:hypothetical protein
VREEYRQIEEGGEWTVIANREQVETLSWRFEKKDKVSYIPFSRPRQMTHGTETDRGDL